MGNTNKEYEITYVEEGDYLLPNLVLPEQKGIGIYGQMHKRFLKKHQPAVYTTLLITGKLQEYLLDIEEQAMQMKERIVHEIAVKSGLDEVLKESAPMEWVGQMNQCCYAAEEIINRELIHHLAVNPNG